MHQAGTSSHTPTASVAFSSLRSGTAAFGPEQEQHLACNLSKTFPIDDDSWTAEQLTSALESWRASLPRVPFYMYDMIYGRDINATLHHLQQCVERAGLSLHDWIFAEWWFVRELQTHPWRTKHPAEATLLVVPVFSSFDIFLHGACGHHAINALRKVQEGALFGQRPDDHLVLAPSVNSFTDKMLSVLTVNHSFIWGVYERATFMEHAMWQDMAKVGAVNLTLALPQALIPQGPLKYCAACVTSHSPYTVALALSSPQPLALTLPDRRAVRLGRRHFVAGACGRPIPNGLYAGCSAGP